MTVFSYISQQFSGMLSSSSIILYLCWYIEKLLFSKGIIPVPKAVIVNNLLQVYQLEELEII